MKYGLILFLVLSLFETQGQNPSRVIIIYKPDTTSLEKDIYNQLVQKWKEKDQKGIWDEKEMRRISKVSSSNGFGEEYIERKFSKIGYRVNWQPISQKPSQGHDKLYGEVGKEVEIYDSGAQSVSSNLKIFDENGNFLFSGSPLTAFKQLKKLKNKVLPD